MKPKDLNLTGSIPYQGVFLPDENFFFRPKLKLEEPLEVTPFIQKEKTLFSWETLSEGYGAVALEYCSGNGDWIIDRAENQRETLWIGIEKRLDRSKKIWAKSKNRGLKNLIIICSEASWFTKHYLVEGQINEVYVNFPDPWPKKRHAHHRLFSSEFIISLSRIVKEGGKVTCVTDDKDYTDWTMSHLQENSSFKLLHMPSGFVMNREGYGSSYFEELWTSKGRDIYYIEALREKQGS